jgi:hypothetical protein
MFETREPEPEKMENKKDGWGPMNIAIEPFNQPLPASPSYARFMPRLFFLPLMYLCMVRTLTR